MRSSRSSRGWGRMGMCMCGPGCHKHNLSADQQLPKAFRYPCDRSSIPGYRFSYYAIRVSNRHSSATFDPTHPRPPRRRILLITHQLIIPQHLLRLMRRQHPTRAHADVNDACLGRLALPVVAYGHCGGFVVCVRHDASSIDLARRGLGATLVNTPRRTPLHRSLYCEVFINHKHHARSPARGNSRQAGRGWRKLCSGPWLLPEATWACYVHAH